MNEYVDEFLEQVNSIKKIDKENVKNLKRFSLVEVECQECSRIVYINCNYEVTIDDDKATVIVEDNGKLGDVGERDLIGRIRLDFCIPKDKKVEISYKNVNDSLKIDEAWTFALEEHGKMN